MADATQEQVITLTSKALEAAKKYLAEEEDPTGKALRVGVSSGGCSGFSYAVSVDVQKDDDLVLSQDGLTVLVDPVSKQFLNGATLDYVDEVGHAGFKFDNPQASSSCGCGASFDVD